MHRRPDIRDRLSCRGVDDEGIVVAVAVARAVSSKRRVRDTRHGCVPLCKSSSNGLENERIGKILWLRDGTGNKAVEHAITKSSQQLRSQVVPHEKLMVSGLTFTIDENVGAVSVGTEQDGILVDFGLGQAGAAVDRLEQCVGDTISETDKVDVSLIGSPVRKQC